MQRAGSRVGAGRSEKSAAIRGRFSADGATGYHWKIAAPPYDSHCLRGTRLANVGNRTAKTGRNRKTYETVATKSGPQTSRALHCHSFGVRRLVAALKSADSRQNRQALERSAGKAAINRRTPKLWQCSAREVCGPNFVATVSVFGPSDRRPGSLAVQGSIASAGKQPPSPLSGEGRGEGESSRQIPKVFFGRS